MKFEVYPKWRGRLVLPSLTAYHELGNLKLDLHDVVEILEHGDDCSKTKRKHGTAERCMQIGKKYVKIVVVEDWSMSLNEHVWLKEVKRLCRQKKRWNGHQKVQTAQNVESQPSQRSIGTETYYSEHGNAQTAGS